MLSHLRSYVLPTALILVSFSNLSQAQEYKAGSLTITQPWVRETPGGAQVGGGFLTITNTGSTPDRLLGGTLSGADRAEVHVTSNEGGMSRMGPVEGGGRDQAGRDRHACPRQLSSDAHGPEKPVRRW